MLNIHTYIPGEHLYMPCITADPVWVSVRVDTQSPLLLIYLKRSELVMLSGKLTLCFKLSPYRGPVIHFKNHQKLNLITFLTFIAPRGVRWFFAHCIFSKIERKDLKGTVSRDFLLLVFFMNQFPPSSPRVFHQDRFKIFSQICGDIRKSRCTTGGNDTAIGKFCHHFRQCC